MDPKQLLLAHFEKLILAGFAGWVIMALVGLAGGGGLNTEDVATMRDEVEAHMQGGSVEEPTKPEWQEDLRRRLAGAPEASEYPSWVFHRRPLYLYEIQTVELAYHPVHRPPVNLAADTETRGQIDLAWSPSIENEYVVTSYELQRREGEEGEWTTVAKLKPSDETRHVDKEISSLLKYYYRVISTAKIDEEDPVVAKYNLTLSDDAKTMISDEVGPVGTKREIFVLPVSVDPVTEQELIDRSQEVGLADVKVRRWDTEESNWQEVSFWRVKVGDTIGEPKKIRGKKEPFDFSTGATLMEVRVEKRDTGRGYEEEWHFIKIKWPDGSEEEINNKEAPE
jgi:hypothetical protein